jgi:site-specific recombinase XerD
MKSINTYYYLLNIKAKRQTTIMIQISKPKERLRFSTGISTAVSDWDIKKRKSKIASINKKIRDIEAKIEDFDNECQLMGKEIDLGELADIFRLKTNTPTKKKLFIDYIQMYYDANLQTKAHNTIKKYKTLINFISLNYPDLTLNDINSTFANNLKNLCLGNNEADNTLNKRFQLIKVVMNWCEDMNFIKDVNLKHFTHPQTPKIQAIFLKPKEIELIAKYDLTEKPNFDSIRDLFVIACYTGIDWADLKQITDTKNFKETSKGNKYFVIKRIKTEGKEIISYPPCNDIVFDILNKRNWKFDFISYDKSLQHLKNICKAIGFEDKITLVSKSGNKKISTTKEKHEFIAWKTARRSFISNSLSSGIQLEMVMSAVGHAKPSTTLIYQHLTAGDMVDAFFG